MPLVVHSATEMPNDGAWRKTGLDRDVFPFFNCWYDVKHSTHTELGETAEDKKFFLDSCKHALYQWPVHIYFMPIATDMK